MIHYLTRQDGEITRKRFFPFFFELMVAMWHEIRQTCLTRIVIMTKYPIDFTISRFVVDQMRPMPKMLRWCSGRFIWSSFWWMHFQNSDVFVCIRLPKCSLDGYNWLLLPFLKKARTVAFYSFRTCWTSMKIGRICVWRPSGPVPKPPILGGFSAQASLQSIRWTVCRQIKCRGTQSVWQALPHKS